MTHINEQHLLVRYSVSNKGGAFHIPQQRLTIVPVTLHHDNKHPPNLIHLRKFKLKGCLKALAYSI